MPRKSELTTTVAVLRDELGLSVEEFGQLIKKSVSTIKKLENGTLALSRETASMLSLETGVDSEWLLAGNAKQPPQVTRIDGSKELYTKEHYERIQAERLIQSARTRTADMTFVVALEAVGDWFSIYESAAKRGEGMLAHYRMRDFLKEMAKRFGKDHKAFMDANPNVRITLHDGGQLAFCYLSWIQAMGVMPVGNQAPVPGIIHAGAHRVTKESPKKHAKR